MCFVPALAGLTSVGNDATKHTSHCVRWATRLSVSCAPACLYGNRDGCRAKSLCAEWEDLCSAQRGCPNYVVPEKWDTHEAVCTSWLSLEVAIPKIEENHWMLSSMWKIISSHRVEQSWPGEVCPFCDLSNTSRPQAFTDYARTGFESSAPPLFSRCTGPQEKRAGMIGKSLRFALGD